MIDSSDLWPFLEWLKKNFLTQVGPNFAALVIYCSSMTNRSDFYTIVIIVKMDSFNMKTIRWCCVTYLITILYVTLSPSKKYLKTSLHHTGSSNEPFISGCQEQHMTIASHKNLSSMATKGPGYFYSNFKKFPFF